MAIVLTFDRANGARGLPGGTPRPDPSRRRDLGRRQREHGVGRRPGDGDAIRRAPPPCRQPRSGRRIRRGARGIPSVGLDPCMGDGRRLPPHSQALEAQLAITDRAPVVMAGTVDHDTARKIAGHPGLVRSAHRTRGRRSRRVPDPRSSGGPRTRSISSGESARRVPRSSDAPRRRSPCGGLGGTRPSQRGSTTTKRATRCTTAS